MIIDFDVAKRKQSSKDLYHNEVEVKKLEKLKQELVDFFNDSKNNGICQHEIVYKKEKITLFKAGEGLITASIDSENGSQELLEELAPFMNQMLGMKTPSFSYEVTDYRSEHSPLEKKDLRIRYKYVIEWAKDKRVEAKRLILLKTNEIPLLSIDYLELRNNNPQLEYLYNEMDEMNLNGVDNSVYEVKDATYKNQTYKLLEYTKKVCDKTRRLNHYEIYLPEFEAKFAGITENVIFYYLTKLEQYMIKYLKEATIEEFIFYDFMYYSSLQKYLIGLINKKDKYISWFDEKTKEYNALRENNRISFEEYAEALEYENADISFNQTLYRKFSPADLKLVFNAKKE